MEVEIAKKLIPKKDIIESFHTKKKASIDLILTVILFLIASILLKNFHVSDRLLSAFNNFNCNLVIELSIVFFIATIGLIIITNRRFKEYKKNLKRSNVRLHTLSRTDVLTQLPNRRAILEKIEYEKLKFERSKEVFTIAMIDLDGFKEINDNYGHECGDYVLKQFSNLMVDLIRKQDVVGRYGGEEFILLLPQTNTGGALHITQLILQQTTKFPITFKDKKISLSATIGVSDYTNNEVTINDLIKMADKAMYEGKSQGKNKVVVAK